MKAAGELLNKKGRAATKQKSFVKNTTSGEENEQNTAVLEIGGHALNILSCSVNHAHTQRAAS